MTLDKFDYQEPCCPLSGGKDFYYPDPSGPQGRVPVARIIEKADALFDKNDAPQAGRLLQYWLAEARALRDRQGELAIMSELVGYYRKQADAGQGLAAVERALELVEALDQGGLPSGATVLINCATACQAFGRPRQALTLFARAEEVYRRTLPAADPRLGGLHNNMALTLTALGRYEEAAARYDKALEVMAQAPQGQLECAITYINLAYLYEASGRPERITEALDYALALLQDPRLPRNGYYAFVLSKCAPAFRDFGAEATCRELWKEAQDIYAGN